MIYAFFYGSIEHESVPGRLFEPLISSGLTRYFVTSNSRVEDRVWNGFSDDDEKDTFERLGSSL